MGGKLSLIAEFRDREPVLLSGIAEEEERERPQETEPWRPKKRRYKAIKVRLGRLLASTMGDQPSHEFSSTEGLNVFRAQFKPFTIPSFSLEAMMPVSLDSRRIIRPDCACLWGSVRAYVQSRPLGAESTHARLTLLRWPISSSRVIHSSPAIVFFLISHARACLRGSLQRIADAAQRLVEGM